MNSEQEKELLEFLASAGFKGEKLERKLKENATLNLPSFKLQHEIKYGEEKMIYDLSFKKDHQFNAYRLEKYNATHRDAIKIDHKTINGIDTAALELRMQGWDWKTYFDHPEKITSNEAKSFIRETTDLLGKLSEGQNFDGIKIQEELMFKYWPEQSYDTSAKQDLKYLYEQHREFSSSEFGMCNADLAYNILSGKLDDLFEKLRTSEIEKYAGADVYHNLERVLSGTPSEFQLEYQRNQPEGFVVYQIPVTQIEDRYQVDSYTVSLTPHPEIDHGVYGGIDTKRLEEQMREIDWHNDKELFIFHENSEPEFMPKVGDIQEQMYRLSQDLVGGDIADQLQLKYWSDATFFSDNLQQTAWDLRDTLPKREQQFPMELNAGAAYNLLSGRAVMIAPQDESESQSWMKLDLSRKDEQGMYPAERITGFSKSNVEALLNTLPIYKARYYPALQGLLNGERTPVILKDEKKVLIEANPVQRTIDLYTMDGRPIPVNLNFDPDWKPSVKGIEELKQQEQKQRPPANQIRPAKSIKRSKGKGI